MSKTIVKSIGSVLAGFVFVFATSVLTDLLMEKLGIFPPQTRPEDTAAWMLFLALVYRTVYTVGGGYITAKLSPNKQMRHVGILATIGTVLAVLGALANWNISSEHWYPVLLAVLAFPSVWLGGKMWVSAKTRAR